MRPKVVDMQHVGRAATAEDMRELACDMVEEAAKEMEVLPPTWILSVHGGLITIVTAWEDDGEKAASRALIRCLLDIMNADAYAFISEVAAGSISPYDDSDAAKQEADNVAKYIGLYGMLDGLPDWVENSRCLKLDDLVFITTCDTNKGSCISTYTCRQSKNRVTLGVRVDDDYGGAAMEGQMVNLFKQPPAPKNVMKLATSFMLSQVLQYKTKD